MLLWRGEEEKKRQIRFFPAGRGKKEVDPLLQKGRGEEIKARIRFFRRGLERRKRGGFASSGRVLLRGRGGMEES
jgi:hypothetical protein